MLQQLQDYLFQYKTVVIPGIGSFQIQEQPATLDMANQLLLPPSYVLTFNRQVSVPQHQLQSLAAAFDNNKEAAETELANFGEALYYRLQQQTFSWQGVGALELSSDVVQFTPYGMDSFLEPVAAQRVLRANVQHTVLVGDQEVRYAAAEYEPALVERKSRPWVLIIGWIIALLALLFWGYHLYTNNWKPEASGLQQKPVIEDAPVQHR